MHRESVLLGADGREEGQKKKGDEEGGGVKRIRKLDVAFRILDST